MRLRETVLSWYHINQRSLPWRRASNEPKDLGVEPYHVWLSEVMLQQTVVETAIPYFKKFTDEWPNVSSLSQASEDEVLSQWAGLGYYSRARNLLACARLIMTRFNGEFPQTEAELNSLPGIGDYTASAILSFAFNHPSVVMDGNIERIISRFFQISEPLPSAKPRLKSLAALLTRSEGARDWPQALMDIASTICRPQSVQCQACPLSGYCQSAFRPDATQYPIKAPKVPKKAAATTIYWVTDGANLLVQLRPANGLLSGMWGLPHEPFHKKDNDISALKQMFFSALEGKAMVVSASFTHVFTHIALKVSLIHVPLSPDQMKAAWPAPFEVRPISQISAMPSLFQKCLIHI